MSGLDLTGWAPIRMDWRDIVEWCYFGEERFTEPFFEGQVQARLQEPFHELFRRYTRYDALREWHERSPGMKPTGFIFHLSRCGSTLITQMLAALPSTVVVSEAPPIDSMVRSELPAPGVSVEQRVEWLRWMVSAFGQPRTGREKYFFVKFDPCSMRYLPLVRAAFADVPWIFVYRDPVEVMVSNMRKPSASLLAAAEPDAVSQGEAVAKVIGTVCEAAYRYHDGFGLPVHYTELPDAVFGALGRHFSLAFSEEEIVTMRRAAQFNARYPTRRFEGDSEGKQREAGEEIRALAEKWIGPHYRQLEELRTDAQNQKTAVSF